MHSLDLCVTIGLLLSVAVAAEDEISRSVLIILSPTCNCLLSLLSLVYLFLIFGGAYLLLSWWVLGVILIFKILDHLQNTRPAVLQSRLV
jgi:hypothetical protein